jgi:hypothetical protein
LYWTVNDQQEFYAAPVVSQGKQRPLSRRIQARLISIMDVPMRLMLGLPFETPLSKHLMLLSYTGRKSGRFYRQPVSYVRDGDILLTPGGGNWKWSMKDAQRIRITIG